MKKFFRSVFFLNIVLWLFFYFCAFPVFPEDQNSAKTYEAVFHPEKFEPFLLPSDICSLDFNKEWQRNRIWILANMAHAAYHPKEYVCGLMHDLGAAKVYFYNKEGAQAFLAMWPEKGILAFRGTQSESLNDLKADMTFMPVSYKTALVHSGFLKELDKIWPWIFRDLEKYKHRPIWVTGHSLGGAMATLAGTRFVFESVITFGEPRVGKNIDSIFQAGHHIRYINGDDPIALMPGIRTEHHGKEIRITDAEKSADWRYDHAIIYYSQNLYKR